MTRLPRWALLLAVLSSSLAYAGEIAAPKLSGPLADAMAAKRVLLVSAHPDDESLFAPLLAEVCRFRVASRDVVYES